MKEVNVWGKIVTSCYNCKYNGYVEDDDTYYCDEDEDAKIVIYPEDYKTIHKDCPFAQPITKEIFEGLIRKKYSDLYKHIELVEKEIGWFVNLYNNKEELLRICYYPIKDKNCMGINIDYCTNYGSRREYVEHEQIKCENPKHLEFILNCIL